MDFNSINTLTDIKDLTKKASSDDGEGIMFELKESQGEVKFQKPHKKLLSKEICAFANTYGGVVCFHFGGDTNIDKFPTGVAQSNYNSLEGWLRDSLEPKLMGMDLKIVDDVFLINVPESKTKPHRNVSESEYYYRHSTISQKMPEIMISSMYRSQDYLNYTSSISLTKSDRQLMFHIYINNLSNLSGSKPKVQIQLYSSLGQHLEFGNNSYFDKYSKDSFQSSQLILDLKIPSIGMVETNAEFANKILYPQDSITVNNFSKPDEDIGNVKYVLVRMDCMFRESIRQTEFRIIEFDDQNKQTIISTYQGSNGSGIITEFSELLKKNEA